MLKSATSDTPAARPANLVEPGSAEHAIIQEEQALLAQVQKALADQQIGEAVASEWDRDPAVNPRTITRALMSSREYQSF